MSGIKRVMDKNPGYRICLANGQGWHMMATQGTSSWVEKLASMMELQPYNGNGYPRLILIRNNITKTKWNQPICYLDEDIHEYFPRSGWKACRVPAFRIWTHCEVSDVVCEMSNDKTHELDIIRMQLVFFPIFQRAQQTGGLPLHSALTEKNGSGFLLVGSGNAGKTTCCSSLRSPWHALCDDETLIVPNGKGQYMAHPLPTWSDYLMYRTNRTLNIQTHLPVSALFFLEQAQTDDTIPLGVGQSAVRLSRHAIEVCRRGWMHLSKKELRALRNVIFRNACEIAKAVPAYILRLSLAGGLCDQIEEVIRKDPVAVSNIYLN
jgi:SynChlorMet cassette protein ScmC